MAASLALRVNALDAEDLHQSNSRPVSIRTIAIYGKLSAITTFRLLWSFNGAAGGFENELWGSCCMTYAGSDMMLPHDMQTPRASATTMSIRCRDGPPNQPGNAP
jgi:hypothetical protein